MPDTFDNLKTTLERANAPFPDVTTKDDPKGYLREHWTNNKSSARHELVELLPDALIEVDRLLKENEQLREAWRYKHDTYSKSEQDHRRYFERTQWRFQAIREQHEALRAFLQSHAPDLLDGAMAMLETIEEDKSPPPAKIVSEHRLEWVADAIEAAECPHREGPFGLYRYEKDGVPSHCVRDFRNPQSTAWGRIMFRSADEQEAREKYERYTRHHIALAAISACQSFYDCKGEQ